MTSSSQTPDRSYLPFRGVKNDKIALLPLKPELREIRCVALLPGSGNDPIACELVYTNINEDAETRMPYIALSYCWGDVEDTVEILLYSPSTDSSGACQEPISAPYRIARNLHVALAALRNESKQFFWIDALCINQQDLREKTHQVQLMGKIYSLAESVLVWLGPDDVYSRFLMRAWRIHVRHALTGSFDIKTYRSICDEVAKGTHPLWTDLAQDKALSQLVLDLGDGMMDDASPDRYYKATSMSFDSLYRRPWWRRIWVLQEVLLAPKRERGGRKVDFRIGDSKLGLEEMLQMNTSLGASYIQQQRDSRPAAHRFFERIRHSWNALMVLDEINFTWEIQVLLALTSKFHASDPRDKLFALLLLASDTRDCFWQEPLINPDYTKSTKAVFDDLVRWKPDMKNKIYVEEVGLVRLTGDLDWSKGERWED